MTGDNKGCGARKGVSIFGSPLRTFGLMMTTVTVVAITACGEMTGPDDSGADATPDGIGMDAVTDTTGDAFDAFDSAADGADVGANDGGSKSDAPHIQLKCADPSQCDAGAPVCCSKLTFDTSNQKCLLDTVSGYCAAESACPTSFQPFCGGDEFVRECNVGADCTEQSYPKCCTFYFNTTFTQSQTGLTICTSQQAAEAADADCTP